MQGASNQREILHKCAFVEDTVLAEEAVRDHAARVEQVEQRVSVLQEGGGHRGHWSERAV